MVEQMPHLSMFFSEFREQLGHLTQKFVLPLLVSTLNDANSQVRKTCHAALLVLVEQNLVDNDDVDKLVCPAILHITEASSAEDQRSEAVTLLCRIAPLLGREITLKHFLEEYKSLCSDSLMQVRKICAASFGEICTVVGPEIVEKELLPHFEHMCNDDLWGVRKACAEVFTIVAGCVRRTTRWEPLSHVYVNLLRDESRWVRLAAYQNLGQFIATFIRQKGEEEGGAPEENKSILDDTPDIARQAEPAVPDLVSELVGQNARPSEPEKIAESDLNSQPNPGSSESGRTVDLNELFSKLVISQTDSVVSPTRYLFCEEMSNGQLMWREPIAELEVDKVLELAERNPAENSDEFIPIGDRDIFNNSNLTPLSASPLPPQPPYTPKSLLGPSQDVIPQDLLDHYLWMVDPSHSESGDTEMARYCAYTLPGVTLTLGKDHWEYLKDLYKTLEGDMQWKVRKTLASSLHELGAILGDDVVNSDLVQSFVWFFKDLDEVRIGALQHLGEFFKLLDPTRRKFVLPKLREFLRLDNERNWRFRLELSEQLVAIISSCDQNDISDHIYPLAMMLIKDKVATVRLSAFKVLSSVIKATHPDLRTITLIDIINETSISQKWYLRQSYPKICEELLDAEAVELEQFCEYLLHPALCLRWDAVPNVRIALAQLVATKLLPNPFFEGPANRFREELTETVNMLQGEDDRDVRFYFDKKEEPSSVAPKPIEVQEAVEP